MCDEAAPIDLLILDFAGVCTPSTAELASTAPGRSIPIRSGIGDVVRSASESDVVVVILSNEISTSWTLSEDLFDRVDHVVSCADNKIWKPDRRAFQRCLLLTGRNAEGTLVVDDELDNITVASSLGMQTLHFDPQEPEASLELVRQRLR